MLCSSSLFLGGVLFLSDTFKLYQITHSSCCVVKMTAPLPNPFAPNTSFPLSHRMKMVTRITRCHYPSKQCEVRKICNVLTLPNLLRTTFLARGCWQQQTFQLFTVPNKSPGWFVVFLYDSRFYCQYKTNLIF